MKWCRCLCFKLLNEPIEALYRKEKVAIVMDKHFNKTKQTVNAASFEYRTGLNAPRTITNEMKIELLRIETIGIEFES